MKRAMVGWHADVDGAWGVLRVLSGRVEITLETHPPITRELEAGDAQPIPPGAPHLLALTGPFRLQVDFLQRDP